MARSRSLCLIFLLAGMATVVGAPSAQARVKTVFAGPVARGPADGDYDAFFRRQVTVNVGDSVRWVEHGFHTVTFVPSGRGEPPLAAPDRLRPIGGAADAVNAPFWFNGQPSLRIPPLVAFRAGGPALGLPTYHNSGLPVTSRPSFPYTLRFTRPGTYSYVCVVHPGMRGSVRVVPRGVPVPSALADRRAAAAEQAADARIASRQRRFTPPAGVVSAGHDAGDVALFRFFPAVITIAAGQSVRFVMGSHREIHTVTFGPPAYRKGLEDRLLTVGRAPTPRQLPPVTLNPLVFLASDPPVLPPYTGSNHGSGFLNSGQLDTIPASPFPSSVTVTFPTSGTYVYECLIHPGMEARVQVR